MLALTRLAFGVFRRASGPPRTPPRRRPRLRCPDAPGRHQHRRPGRALRRRLLRESSANTTVFCARLFTLGCVYCVSHPPGLCHRDCPQCADGLTCNAAPGMMCAGTVTQAPCTQVTLPACFVLTFSGCCAVLRNVRCGGCELWPDSTRAVRQLAAFRESANPGDAAVQPGIHAGFSL